MKNVSGHNLYPTLSAVAQVITQDTKAESEVGAAQEQLNNATALAAKAKVRAYGHMMSFLIGYGHDPKLKTLKGSTDIQAGLVKETGLSKTTCKRYVENAASLMRNIPSLAKAATDGPETASKALEAKGYNSQTKIDAAKVRFAEADKIQRATEKLEKKGVTNAKEKATEEVKGKKVETPKGPGKVRHGQETKDPDLSTLNDTQLADLIRGAFSRIQSPSTREELIKNLTRMNAQKLAA